MSQFKRKDEGGGFQASDGQEPDFSALEPATGFSAGELEKPRSGGIAKAAPEPSAQAPQQDTGNLFGPIQAQPDQSAKPQPRPAEAAPAPESKKRYYNPGEVMKKKGCIGCGGMILAVPLLIGTLAALAVAIH